MGEPPANKRGTEAEPGHAPALDGVRGLAILAVISGHLLNSNDISSSSALQLLLDLRDQLWVGVTLFFSLSGFLITGILYDTLHTEKYFRTFYGRRILRIFPLYYGFLGVLLALTPVLHLDWHGEAWRLWTYTGNIPLPKHWDSNPAPFINLKHFWSLAVEEQFYLIWPLAVYWLRSWRRIFIATLVGSTLALVLRCAMVNAGFIPLTHSLPFCMDSLLLGGTLALLARSRFRPATLRWAPWVFSAVAAMTVWFAAVNPGAAWVLNPYFSTIGMTILAIGTTALVATALSPSTSMEKSLRIRPLRFLGTYSYGIYVYHYSVDAAWTGRLRAWFLAHGASKPLSIVGAALPVAVLSILIAFASYHLYEKHFLRMKRFFPYRKPVRTAELVPH